MNDEVRRDEVRDVARAADRLDDVADTAELMGDAEGAASWRTRATILRLHAMTLMDE